MASRYSIQIYGANDGFIAICPEFPSLSTFGKTRKEALEEIQMVLELVVQTYHDTGWPLPDAKEPPIPSRVCQ